MSIYLTSRCPYSAQGILAADESIGTIGKRFDRVHLANNIENRSSYREMLFKTDGFERYISGVILFEETLYGATKDGTPFVDLLVRKGVLPGIKVLLKAQSISKSFCTSILISRSLSFLLS